MKNLAAVGLMLSLTICYGSKETWADFLNDGGHDNEVLRPQTAQPWAGSYNFGLGINFADVPDNLSAGWDVLAGFEKTASNGWDYGAQVHLLNGSFIPDTSFNSVALYATARPENKWLRWLQFKAGVVNADFSDTSLKLVQQPPYYNYAKQTTTWSGTGAAVGVGIVGGDGDFRWHLLDIHRYFVAGRSFNTYSIGLHVVFELIVQK